MNCDAAVDWVSWKARFLEIPATWQYHALFAKLARWE
jgi:hypothetical protein